MVEATETEPENPKYQRSALALNYSPASTAPGFRVRAIAELPLVMASTCLAPNSPKKNQL